MSQTLWRIGTDAKAYTADDMSGTGAKLSGGRWNEVGVAVVYAANSRALACLETLVHLNAGGLPLNRFLVEIEVPPDIWTAASVADPATLDIGWDAEPAGRVSISFGSNWVSGNHSALLLVPSIVVPEEWNVLINPAHPDAGRISARKVRKWLYDPRLDQKTGP